VYCAQHNAVVLLIFVFEGVNHRRETSHPEFAAGNANANCSQIFKKYRSAFTKTRHFKHVLLRGGA